MDKRPRWKTTELLVLVTKLKELWKKGEGDHDWESAHMHADELLLDFIADNKVREVFRKVARWYA